MFLIGHNPGVADLVDFLAVDPATVGATIDAKPKSTLALRRLDNVRAVARAVMLVDHYAEEWAALWWVRIDGRARVIDSGPEFDHALQLLAGKHEQYLRGAPRGPDMLQGTQAGTAAALDLPGAWLTDAQ